MLVTFLQLRKNYSGLFSHHLYSLLSNAPVRYLTFDYKVLLGLFQLLFRVKFQPIFTARDLVAIR